MGKWDTDRRGAFAGIGAAFSIAQAGKASPAGAASLTNATGFAQLAEFGAKADGGHDDSDAINSAILSGRRILPEFTTYTIAKPIRISHEKAMDFSGAILRQARGANLARLATIAVSLENAPLQSTSTVLVDGAREWNRSDVVGIEVRKLKVTLGQLTLAAHDCGTGVRVRGQVEYARISAHAERCDVGVHVLPDQKSTPDELLLDVVAHDCGTFFNAQGLRKMTGTVHFACEQSNSWGAIFEDIGWWQVFGIMRACGKQGGGGLKLDGAQLRGDLKIVCGSEVNCEWASDIVTGRTEGLILSVAGRYANGVRVAGGVEGSLKLFLQTMPRGVQGGLVLGASSAEPLDGYLIEDGSRILARDGALAMDLQNCRNCYVGAGQLSGVCRISSSAYGNTIIVPRKYALDQVLFDNRRSQCDNRIVYRGVYTLEQLRNLNRGAPFVGMEAEMCSDLAMRRVRFDGRDWVWS